MASETITAGLKKYGIGSKLRRLRLRKSMGLVELSKHTGLSPALLSKLERDLMHPTLPTLWRIAMVFSVGLEYFFNPESTRVLEIVRKKDRLRFPDSPNGKQVAYYFESLDFPVPDRALHSYLAEFEPTEAEHIKSTNIRRLNSCRSCPVGWNYAPQMIRTSWPMATLFTSIALCRTATAN